MSEEIAVDTVETTETPDIDWEARAKKAEAKIVELKKTGTQTQEEPQAGLSKQELEAFYNEKKFFESNPDMSEYKDKLSEYTSKGLSWEEARVLVEKQDPSFENRKVSQKMNFTAWDIPVDNVVTKEMLAQADQNEYNRLMDMVESGKAKLTN